MIIASLIIAIPSNHAVTGAQYNRTGAVSVHALANAWHARVSGTSTAHQPLRALPCSRDGPIRNRSFCQQYLHCNTVSVQHCQDPIISAKAVVADEVLQPRPPAVWHAENRIEVIDWCPAFMFSSASPGRPHTTYTSFQVILQGSLSKRAGSSRRRNMSGVESKYERVSRHGGLHFSSGRAAKKFWRLCTTCEKKYEFWAKKYDFLRYESVKSGPIIALTLSRPAKRGLGSGLGSGFGLGLGLAGGLAPGLA